MIYVSTHFIFRQRFYVVLEGDSLAQLANRLARELAVELGLAEQHHLQQLALLGLQVGQQAQRLERLERHRLALVHAQHHAFALARQREQRAGDALEQVVLVGSGIDLHAELVGELEQQRARLEPGWGYRR